MEGRQSSMVQMFAPQGSGTPERHVNSAAGRHTCTIPDNGFVRDPISAYIDLDVQVASYCSCLI
jgi:hypothetical protein